MATNVHIGGVGAGLQELAQAGAAVKVVGGGTQSFAAQFQKMQGACGTSASGTPVNGEAAGAGWLRGVGSARSVAVEPETVSEPAPAKIPEAGERAQPAKVAVATKEVPLAAVVKAPVAVSFVREAKVGIPTVPIVKAALPEALGSKSVAPKKASGPPVKVAAADSTGSGKQSVADVAVAPVDALPMPMPVAVVEMAKVAVGDAGVPIFAAKVPVGRGHETKKPVATVHEVARVGSETKAEAVAVLPAAEAAAGRPVAAPVAEGAGGNSVSGTGSGPGVVFAVPEVALAHAPASTGQGAHRLGNAPAHAVHEEMEPGTGVAAGETRMLVSTPNVLEVGITGGAHGWLRVRAELEHTGEVTASLMASSTASADALHKELGSISAYLKSEAVGVSSLAVSATEKGGAAPGTGGSSASAGTPTGGGGRQGQQSGEGGPKPSAWAGLGNATSGLGTSYGSQAVPPALLGTGVGGWLNVRV